VERKVLVVCVAALIVMPLGLVGCKGKVEKGVEEPKIEMTEAVSQSESALPEQPAVTEPAQNVATEAIPPTAQLPATAPVSMTALLVTLERTSGCPFRPGWFFARSF